MLVLSVGIQEVIHIVSTIDIFTIATILPEFLMMISLKPSGRRMKLVCKIVIFILRLGSLCHTFLLDCLQQCLLGSGVKVIIIVLTLHSTLVLAIFSTRCECRPLQLLLVLAFGDEFLCTRALANCCRTLKVRYIDLAALFV